MRVKIKEVVGEIDTLPGCSQVGVSHSVFIPPDLRGKGLGKKANAIRLGYMQEHLCYDYALCTVDLNNARQVHILIENGWQKLDEFISSKTGHRVALYGRRLNDSETTRKGHVAPSGADREPDQADPLREAGGEGD